MNAKIGSFEYVDSHHSIIDINQAELKEQSEKAKRFVNSITKNHPQIDNIKGALQVLNPKQLISILKNTENAIKGHGDSVDLTHQELPSLVQPNVKTTHENTMNASAWMIALLGKITQLTSDTSLQKQLLQLKAYNANMEGAGNSYSELATLLESQGQKWTNDSDALNEARTESARLEKEVKLAESCLLNAQATLDKLEAESQRKDPIPAQLIQQIDEAKKNVSLTQATADKTALVFNQYTNSILLPVIKAENTSMLTLANTLAQSRALTSSMSSQQQIMLANQRKKSDQQAKSLAFLVALMTQLIDKSASDGFKATAELQQKLSEARAKDAEKKALEYEENVRKSEEMQKTMGCIGKILGWVITAVSFATALFTGGASLAFAAIGLALIVGDEISQAVNGVSFMAEAMKPLMESIIQPMMEFLGKVFSQILELFGLDKATADMVGQIMGAIAAAIVMVAAVIVAGNVASKLSSMAMKSFGTKVMDKVLNNVVGDMMKRVGQGLGYSLGLQENTAARIVTYSNIGLTGMSVVNTVVQTTGNIITAEMKLNAAKAKAQLLNSIALQNLLNEILDRAADAFKTRIELTNAIVKNIASISDSKMQAGKYITRKMGTVAG